MTGTTVHPTTDLAGEPRPADPPTRMLTVRVRDLVLDYEIYEDRRAALRQRLVTKTGSGKSLVHALKGVSFDVSEGDAVGVIGSNGSGKSTLLAAIAGLLPPTSGEILVSDEPKLLGVGATLMPAATGYRNIRLGCMALGMPATDVDAMIDSIVAFTDLGDAIHRPLRTYSSGMRARLHFAIATSVRPRILLIDEALAVGDKAFRAKSGTRIAEIVSGTGTLMLVSHSMDEVRRLCNRVLWVEKGVLVHDGPVDDVLAAYHA